jgi:hypothetical protein
MLTTQFVIYSIVSSGNTEFVRALDSYPDAVAYRRLLENRPAASEVLYYRIEVEESEVTAAPEPSTAEKEKLLLQLVAEAQHLAVAMSRMSSSPTHRPWRLCAQRGKIIAAAELMAAAADRFGKATGIHLDTEDFAPDEAYNGEL